VATRTTSVQPDEMTVTYAMTSEQVAKYKAQMKLASAGAGAPQPMLCEHCAKFPGYKVTKCSVDSNAGGMSTTCTYKKK
jgi:hypothetical protein